MTATATLLSLASSVWNTARDTGVKLDVDVKTLTLALCLSNDPSGLQALFDAALTDVTGATKDVRPILTTAYNGLMKRAYGHATKAGFTLAMPRLDGKGAILRPTVTPVAETKAAAQAKAAEDNARREKALADHAARQQSAAHAALAALTASDIIAAAFQACQASGVKVTDAAIMLLSLAESNGESLSNAIMAIREDWEYFMVTPVGQIEHGIAPVTRPARKSSKHSAVA